MPSKKPNEDNGANLLASDVVLRSVAAPTYFPSFQKHIDGAVFDQNPAASALSLAISPNKLNIPIERIAVISLSTGNPLRFVEGDSHNWGIAQWLPKVTGLLWDGMLLKVDSFCHELLDDRYWRLDPILLEETPMDDPKESLSFLLSPPSFSMVVSILTLLCCSSSACQYCDGDGS